MPSEARHPLLPFLVIPRCPERSEGPPSPLVMPNAVRHLMRSGGDPSLALGMTTFFTRGDSPSLSCRANARHPMMRPLGQSPRGDTGACHAERMRGIPFPFPCHSEVSRAKRRTPRNLMRRSLASTRDDRLFPCHAERSEASLTTFGTAPHEEWRGSLASARDDKRSARGDNLFYSG